MIGDRPELFRGRHFADEAIVLCVRWYLRYSLSYRDLPEMMMERHLSVDPSTIWRWVQRYAPELNARIRRELKPTNGSWRTDETWFAKIPSADKALTGSGIDGKNRRDASALSVRVSIRPLAPQRTSGRCHRERRATNADSSLSTKTEASAADDRGSVVLGLSPQGVVRLAPSFTLCSGR